MVEYLSGGRIQGSSVAPAGKVGNANWKSTTGNSGIQLGTSAIITGDFTVGMWIKKNNTQTACVFATDDAGSGSGNITLKWHSNSAYAMWLVYDASTHIKAVSDSYHSETGVWRHVTVTGINNSGTLSLTMYVDGVSKGTATDSTTTRSDDNIKTIGNEPSAGDGLIGELDEFFIYNRGLSISEVLSIADGSKKPDDATLNTSSSLRCYLPLDSDYNDTSGQSNNGSESSVGSLDGNGSLVSLESQDEKASITNVPLGTRYEETDTRKIFRRTVAVVGDETTVSSLTDMVFDTASEIGDLTYSGNEITLSSETYSRHGINGSEHFQNSGTQTLECVAEKTGTSAWVFFGLASAKAVDEGVNSDAPDQMAYGIKSADDGRTWYKTGATTWTPASNTSDNVTFKIVNDRSTVTYYADGSSIGSTSYGTPAAAYYSMCMASQTGTAGSYTYRYSGDVIITVGANAWVEKGTA